MAKHIIRCKKCRFRIFPANQPIDIGKDMNILVHVGLF